jgi:hypothetical protein
MKGKTLPRLNVIHLKCILIFNAAAIGCGRHKRTNEKRIEKMNLEKYRQTEKSNTNNR